MNVAPVKTGKRGRPAFRRFSGRISASGSHWIFTSDDPDFFAPDFVFLAVSSNFPLRAKNCIRRVLQEGRYIEVVLSFSGVSHVLHSMRFYDCRFVCFPSWVDPA